MIPAVQSTALKSVSRLLSILAVVSASVASGYLLFPTPLADVFFSGIVLLSVIFALVGVVGAWTDRTVLAWVAAILETGLTMLGMLSIGFVLIPTALFSLGTAISSHLAGPRVGVQQAISSDPPTVPEAVLKTLGGTVSIAVGAGLVYFGSFRRELFGSCANETLACAVETTHWDAVGITGIGLTAACIGGWLVWKQIYISRVLTSNRTG
jgi:hypothetical protein